MEEEDYPEELIIKSKGGVFLLKITKNKNRNSTKVESYTINLGSDENKCVQITIPPKRSNNKDAYLLWVEAEENCSMEKYIEKGFTQHMMNLGITIARDINSSLERITFKDTSSFKCSLPNGEKKTVNMKKFYIAFHGSTWYEYYFDAFLEKDHELYLKAKKKLDDPKYKPDTFDFVNKDLNEILTPLYDLSETWNDFFQAIQTKFGNKKCAVIYPWIDFVIEYIFDTGEIKTSWIIDLKANDATNKTPLIEFEAYEVKRGPRRGGYTRKKKGSGDFSISGFYPMLPYPKIMALNYRRFLRY